MHVGFFLTFFFLLQLPSLRSVVVPKLSSTMQINPEFKKQVCTQEKSKAGEQQHTHLNLKSCKQATPD